MQKTHGLSVIVPIYNVEDYIEECLQSIVESMGNLEDIQIVLVDDGSKDDSGRIAMEYAAAHSKFIYLSKENGGLSDARNYGLNYVKYDFVAFLDSDDFIQKPFFAEIFKALPERPDMIIFDWWDVENGILSQVVKGMDFAEGLWTVQPSAWNKVFKTSLFEKVQFPKGQLYEDVGTIYKLLHYTDAYTYISKPLYSYRKNRGGSILTTVSLSINDIYIALEDTYDFYMKQDALSDKNREGLCYQYVKLLCWSNMHRQLEYYKYNLWGFHKKMKSTRQLMNFRFPEWKNNDYLKKNTSFFEKRLGGNYIKRLDYIGKSPFRTFNTVIFIVSKNRKKVIRKNLSSQDTAPNALQ